MKIHSERGERGERGQKRERRSGVGTLCSQGQSRHFPTTCSSQSCTSQAKQTTPIRTLTYTSESEGERREREKEREKRSAVLEDHEDADVVATAVDTHAPFFLFFLLKIHNGYIQMRSVTTVDMGEREERMRKRKRGKKRERGER